LQSALGRFETAYTEAERDNTVRKLGLAECRDEDVTLIRDLHGLLHAHEVDMTLWFRALVDMESNSPSLGGMENAVYDETKRRAGEVVLSGWLGRYAARLGEDPMPAHARRARMLAANPQYVLRNWLAQEAIDRAHGGDMGGIGELLEVMRRPYDTQPGREHFAGKRPDWAKNKAGCSMLSCSS